MIILNEESHWSILLILWINWMNLLSCQKESSLCGDDGMVATKDDAYSMIEAVSENDFSELKVFLNTSFGKTKKRKDTRL